MKLCFVGLENLPVLAEEYNQYGVGGEQVQQTLLAKAFRYCGHDVSMVVYDYGQLDGKIWNSIITYKAYKIKAGLPVLRFIHPRWTGLWSALKRADADIYYTSCAGMLVGLLALYCDRYKRGLVFKLASDADADPKKLLIKYKRDKMLYSYGLRHAGAVLSQHKSQQRQLETNYGVSSDVAGMLVEPAGRDIDLSDRDVLVLWVNNLRNLKRPDLALDLARILPDYSMHMIGGSLPGYTELYKFVELMAHNMPNLTFHGQIPYQEIGDFYDRARVFVNTSDIEGFPNSYLQSWRRGVPVVAFFDPDGLIKREGLGYCVKDLNEMKKSVEKLLTDDNEWKRISKRCRHYMNYVLNDDVVLEPYNRAFKTAFRKAQQS
jgi:glycosyltransferase involved in cell wall biosynthesis